MRTQNGVVVGYILGVVIAGVISLTASAVFAEQPVSAASSQQQAAS